MAQHADPRQIADPFGEILPPGASRRYRLLGAEVEFRSHEPDLLALVDQAYRGVPEHALDGPRLLVELRLAEGGQAFGSEPPAARMFGGAGLLGAATDAHNLAIVHPESGRAVVHLSRAMLAFPYHARYELIEFAVFTLASRAQRLVPLHAGCVGAGGIGALLIGASGAGKSTLALHASQLGLEFLTEDACFVEPDSMRVTGIANFLHLRVDAPERIDDPTLRDRILAAPVIRRRSGIAKYELDLRTSRVALAAGPMRLAHLVFASPDTAPDGDLLRPLGPREWLDRFEVSQSYAAAQPGWAAFVAGCGACHGWDLRRGSHPAVGAAALKALLTA